MHGVFSRAVISEPAKATNTSPRSDVATQQMPPLCGEIIEDVTGRVHSCQLIAHGSDAPHVWQSPDGRRTFRWGCAARASSVGPPR